jgi:hypothetical protein
VPPSASPCGASSLPPGSSASPAGTHLRQLRNLNDPLATLQARIEEARLQRWPLASFSSARTPSRTGSIRPIATRRPLEGAATRHRALRPPRLDDRRHRGPLPPSTSSPTSAASSARTSSRGRPAGSAYGGASPPPPPPPDHPGPGAEARNRAHALHTRPATSRTRRRDTGRGVPQRRAAGARPSRGAGARSRPGRGPGNLSTL